MALVSVKVNGGLAVGTPKVVATGAGTGNARIAAGIGRSSSTSYFPVRLIVNAAGEVQATAGGDVPAGAPGAYIWGQVALPR